MKNLITCLVVCVLSSAAFADTIYVPKQYSTIELAIFAAGDGDEIIVGPGIYVLPQGQLNITKSIQLRSSDGSEKTFITTFGDGYYGGRMRFGTAASSGSSVEGFTFTSFPFFSTPLRFEGMSGFAVRNCRFTLHAGGNNHCLGTNAANDGIIENCVFENNLAGGIFFDTSENILVKNCIFTSNTANNGGYGGGIYANYANNLSLADCTFENNTGANDGGGMYNSNSSPTLTDCIFESNTAENSGGMGNNSNSSPTLTNCTFTNNTAADKGGGMFNENDSSPTLTNCTFTTNTANNGGGMFNENGSSPTLDGCTFASNTATNGGGIGNQDDSNPTLDGCTFASNTATNDGGGMGNWSCGSATLTNCNFTNNDAHDDGGGMNNVNSSPMLISCRLENNIAYSWGGSGDGGGMSNANNSSPTLTDTVVCGNTPDQIYPINSWIDNGGNYIADECDSDEDEDGITDDIDNCYLYNPDQLDCNGNEIGDVCDIADGTSHDLNLDGIPDECEDSDGDGIPDNMDAFPNDPNEWADSDGDGMGDNEDHAALGVCCVNSGCDQLAEVTCSSLGGTWTEAGSCDDCVAPPETCDADLDGDGEVKVADLLLLIGAWGVCP